LLEIILLFLTENMIRDLYSQNQNTVNHEEQPREKQRVIVVTGGSRGIGLEIVKGLAELKTPYRIVLTAREDTKGKEVIKKNRSPKEHPKYPRVPQA